MPARKTRAQAQHVPGSSRPRRTAGVKRLHARDEEEVGSSKQSMSDKALDERRTDNMEPLAVQQQAANKEIDEDDLCPVCQLLLYNPVITGCGHTLCKSCMGTWAETSVGAAITIVSVDEQPQEFDAVTGLEAKCPMCRTQTSALLDAERAWKLQSTYSVAYGERQKEEEEDLEHKESIQTITVYIGNLHQLIKDPEEDRPQNVHDWSFFVRPSRIDIVEEVQIFLHPTFRPPRIIKSRPPYEVRRVGWGYFTIEAGVILKSGYSWVSSDAENSPDGAENGMLRLEWTLDFSSFGGTGAMGRCKLKVKNDRQWVDVSDEEERDQAEWSRMVRQYQRYGRYEPPEE